MIVDKAQSGLSSSLLISEAELPVTKDFRKNLQSKRNSSVGMSLRSRRFADVRTDISISNLVVDWDNKTQRESLCFDSRETALSLNDVTSSVLAPAICLYKDA
jgi:hypothetical protein